MNSNRFQKTYNQIKRRLFSNPGLARVLIVVFVSSIIVGVLFLVRPYSGHILSLLSPLESQLNNVSGRTNLVILGIGGSGHEAPNLTDTIIFASVKLSTGEITLLSLPRDIWVPSMRAKINTAYHYGEKRQPNGGGLVLAKAAVTEIVNQPVHYAVVLDFSTFVKLVNILGGLDVSVENTFTDPQYPLLGKENDDCGGNDPHYLCRYESISFTAGNQTMNGDTALKYVRSRHSGLESEGTDFARSRRQVQVLKALRAKYLSLVKNPKNYSLILDSYNLITSELITDFPQNKPMSLAKLAYRARRHDLKTNSLSEPDTLFHPPVSPSEDNQWVLLPKGNNPQLVFDYVKELLN